MHSSRKPAFKLHIVIRIGADTHVLFASLAVALLTATFIFLEYLLILPNAIS